MSTIPRILVLIGIVLIVIGLAWPWIQKLGLGRLPGDLIIEREYFRFYCSITTSFLISILLTLNFWLMRKYEILVDIVRARYLTQERYMDVSFAELTMDTRQDAKDVKSNRTTFRILDVFALVS